LYFGAAGLFVELSREDP